MLSILILLSCAYVALSAESCETKTPCSCVFPNKTVIDISSVGSPAPNKPRFYQVAFENVCDENITELFSYNPCFPFDSSDKLSVPADENPCIGAAACIRKPGLLNGTSPEEYIIGLQSSAEFMTSVYGIFLVYTVPKSKRTLNVSLICDPESQDRLDTIECSGPVINVKLHSKCACPNGCSSTIPDVSSPGLSVGSKILISFFTILLGYILVGIVWNYCNGSRGVELIPNIEFWNDLPTLIMEGVSFACSCCGRQSTYGEV